MKQLTREQMKDIVGGVEEGGHCIHCLGMGGACGGWTQICYYRSNNSGNADSICRGIYSGCEDAYGYWGDCDGCIMN